MQSEGATSLKLAATIALAVIPMLIPQLPWTFAVATLTVALGLAAHVVYAHRQTAVASWASWAPKVVAIAVAVLIVFKVDQLGEPAILGWVLILVAAIVIAAMVILLLYDVSRAAPAQAAGPPPVRASRIAFDDVQSVKNLPAFLGGNDLLRLGNLATLKLGVPYSLEMVTMVLDATPIRLPGSSDEAVEIDGVTLTLGSKAQFVFDVKQNQRHEITVAGRTYLVTLLETKKLDIANVGAPYEFVFGITEK